MNAPSTPVDEMNRAGGVLGNPVVLVVADDASSVETARAAFTSLVDESGVDAIVGPSSSEIAVDLVGDLAEREVVMCSGSNTAGALSTADSGGFYFRTAPPDRLQALAMAELLEADGRRDPVVVAPRDAYGQPFARQVVQALAASDIDGRIELYDADADAAAVVARATEPAPDAIVLIGFPDATAPIIGALAAAGHGPNQFPVYGTDGLQSADLGTAVDAANPGVIAGMRGTVAAGTPGGTDHAFHQRMLDAGVEPFFSASTYDCTILLGLAALAAGSDDPRELQEAFARNLTGRTRCSSFAECATYLADDRRIDYDGAFSTYDRWNGLEPGSGVFDVWTMGLDARPATGPVESQLEVG